MSKKRDGRRPASKPVDDKPKTKIAKAAKAKVRLAPKAVAKAIAQPKPPQKNKTARKMPPSKKSAPAGKVSQKAPKNTIPTAAEPAQKKQSQKPASSGKTPFNARDLKAFRELLLRLREKLTGRISTLVQDSLTLSPSDGDVDYRSEEEGAESFDRDFVLSRASSDQDVVFEIDDALNRVELGTYGGCETCQNNIEKLRLEALPYSRMCVDCQGVWEQGQQRRRSFEPMSLFPSSDKGAPDPGDEE